MANALFLYLDDEFDFPLYQDPPSDELDKELVVQVRQCVLDVLEDEAKPQGTKNHGELRIGWKHHAKTLLTFVAVVDDEVLVKDLEQWLSDLFTAYFDEVDDPTSPDRDGLADVIIDVIPPWED